jgi:DNA-binding beta-propeller fold protein YncE
MLPALGRPTGRRRLAVPALLVVAALAFVLSGCASSADYESRGGEGSVRQDSAPRPGTTVVAMEFLNAYENEPGAFYYPIQGLAACEYSADGTLIFCDDNRGRVFGLDPGSLVWYEFDNPNTRPYRPVDIQVDGFKVLILDAGGNSIFRFNLSGSWLDKLVDVRDLDPAVLPQTSGFAVDRDGRMVISDTAQQQVLLLDAFLNLNMRLGSPGSLDDQFTDPGGLTFLPDGSIVVSDRANRRLARYGRLGFYEQTIGGDFDPANPFLAPQGLDSDRFGNLFVADQGNGLIHVFDRRLRLLFSAGREFGIRGTPLGPVDVAVGPNGQLAVLDRARSAILVYRLVYE